MKELLLMLHRISVTKKDCAPEEDAESAESVIRLSYNSKGYYDMTVVKAVESPITYTDMDDTSERISRNISIKPDCR